MDDDPFFTIDQMTDKSDDVLVARMEDEFAASLSNSTNTLCASTETEASTEAPPPQPIINGGATTTVKSPKKQGKRNPVILSFSNSSIMTENAAGEEEVGEESPKVGAKKNKSRVRPPSQTYDHIIAERKRREQLSRLFVALSALVPGLKKMDKTSVLGDAVSYLKQLQERVKKLEEETMNENMESVVVVKKSQLLVNDGDEEEGSCEETCHEHNEPLQEIGAIGCGRSILLRIRCCKQKGVLVRILSEIENLNLTVVNTSVAQFGDFSLDVTIIAEMEQEFSLTVTDVVKKLRTTLRHTDSAINWV